MGSIAIVAWIGIRVDALYPRSGRAPSSVGAANAVAIALSYSARPQPWGLSWAELLELAGTALMAAGCAG